MSEIEGADNKKHKPYDDENIVINDNTFYKYMKHIYHFHLG